MQVCLNNTLLRAMIHHGQLVFIASSSIRVVQHNVALTQFTFQDSAIVLAMTRQ